MIGRIWREVEKTYMGVVEWFPPYKSTALATTHIHFFIYAQLYVNVEKMSWIWETNLLMIDGLDLWNGILSKLQKTQGKKTTIVVSSKKSSTMISSTRNPKLCNNQKINLFWGMWEWALKLWSHERDQGEATVTIFFEVFSFTTITLIYFSN